MSRSPNQKVPIKFHLCLELFVFLFLLLQAEHLITMAITTINMIFICSTTWNSATYLMITRANRLSHRVSSIHQNKIRAFNLSLFANWWQPFHKYMNWNLIEFVLLAQVYFPCVKGYGQVSWTPIGSISSPYICAKSLDWSLHICMDWKCGRAMSTKSC